MDSISHNIWISNGHMIEERVERPHCIGKKAEIVPASQTASRIAARETGTGLLHVHSPVDIH